MAFSRVYYVISRHSNIYKQTRLAQQTVAESGKFSNREPTYNFMGAVLQAPNSEVYSFTSHLPHDLFFEELTNNILDMRGAMPQVYCIWDLS